MRIGKKASRPAGAKKTAEVLFMNNTKDPARDPQAIMCLFIIQRFSERSHLERLPDWRSNSWRKLAIFPATSNPRSEGYFPCQGVSADQIRHWLKSSATEIGVSVARLTLTEKGHLGRRIARDYTIGNGANRERVNAYCNWTGNCDQSTGDKFYGVSPDPEVAKALAGFRKEEITFILHLDLFPAISEPYQFSHNEGTGNRDDVIELLGGRYLASLRGAISELSAEDIPDSMPQKERKRKQVDLLSLQAFGNFTEFIFYCGTQCLPLVQREFPDWQYWLEHPFDTLLWKQWSAHVCHVVKNALVHPAVVGEAQAGTTLGLGMVAQTLHSQMINFANKVGNLTDAVHSIRKDAKIGAFQEQDLTTGASSIGVARSSGGIDNGGGLS